MDWNHLDLDLLNCRLEGIYAHQNPPPELRLILTELKTHGFCRVRRPSGKKVEMSFLTKETGSLSKGNRKHNYGLMQIASIIAQKSFNLGLGAEGIQRVSKILKTHFTWMCFIEPCQL